MIDSASCVCDVGDIFSIINNFLPILLGTLYLNIYLNSVLSIIVFKNFKIVNLKDIFVV